MKRLTKKKIDAAIAKGREVKLWDGAERGLYLRVREGSHTGIFAVQYRSRKDGKQRSITIGRFGEDIERDGQVIPLTIENARAEAGRVKALDVGEKRDAKAALPTLDAEAARWLVEQVEPHNTERTAKLYGWMMRRHILPALGSRIVAEISKSDCQALHNSIGKAHGHRNANHALAILGSCLGWCGVEVNAARMTRKKGGIGIRRFAEVERERVFTADESARIGEAIRAMENDGALSAADAGFFRALALTGLRPDELLSLRWGCVGDDEIEFAKATKGGEADPRDAIVLTPPLRAVLAKLERGDDDALVFRVYKHHRLFNAILKRAGIERGKGADKAVAYSLRHTYATRAASSMPLAVVATLLGHARISTTEKYLHLSRDDDPVRRAAYKHAESIAASLDRTRAG
jgi:integrase